MQIHKCMKTQPLPCPCEHYSVHIVNSFTHSHSLACLCTFFLVRLCTLNHYLPCASPQLHLGWPSVIPGTCELFRRCMQLFHQCATLPPIWVHAVQCKYTNIKNTNTQIHKCTNTQMYKYKYAIVSSVCTSAASAVHTRGSLRLVVGIEEVETALGALSPGRGRLSHPSCPATLGRGV